MLHIKPKFMNIRTIKSPLTKEEIKLRKKEFLKNKKIVHKQYNLYISLLNIFKNNLNLTGEIKLLLENIQNGLEKMTKFMIEDRFDTPQKKKVVRKKQRKSINPDELEFFGLGPKPKTKKESLQLLDIIKFFKTLENFILKRSDLLYQLEELQLGQFSITASEVIANLKTLLLSSVSLDDKNRKLLLDYVFSLVCIYRHFKVKTTPDVSTISGEYEGSPLDQLECDWFSQEKLSN